MNGHEQRPQRVSKQPSMRKATAGSCLTIMRMKLPMEQPGASATSILTDR